MKPASTMFTSGKRYSGNIGKDILYLPEMPGAMSNRGVIGVK